MKVKIHIFDDPATEDFIIECDDYIFIPSKTMDRIIFRCKNKDILSYPADRLGFHVINDSASENRKTG